MDREPPEPRDLYHARYICQFCAAVWRNPAALMDFGPCHRCGRNQGLLNPDDPSPEICAPCSAEILTTMCDRLPALLDEYESVDMVVAYVEQWLIEEGGVRPEWAEAYAQAWKEALHVQR